MKYLWWIIVSGACLIAVPDCYGQEDEEAETMEYNLPVPDWKKGLKGGKIEGCLYSYEAESERYRFTSSFSEKYPVTNLTDQNIGTAWVEKERGPGVNEVVVFDYYPDGKQMLWIFPGYGKSKALYEANNRPRKICVYLLGTFCHDCTPQICITANPVVLGYVDKELTDAAIFQQIVLPKIAVKDNTADCGSIGGHDTDPSRYKYLVAIEILSVYKGTKYDDTCISEVVNDSVYKQLQKQTKSK